MIFMICMKIMLIFIKIHDFLRKYDFDEEICTFRSKPENASFHKVSAVFCEAKIIIFANFQENHYFPRKPYFLAKITFHENHVIIHGNDTTKINVPAFFALLKGYRNHL